MQEDGGASLMIHDTDDRGMVPAQQGVFYLFWLIGVSSVPHRRTLNALDNGSLGVRQTSPRSRPNLGRRNLYSKRPCMFGRTAIKEQSLDPISSSTGSEQLDDTEPASSRAVSKILTGTKTLNKAVQTRGRSNHKQVGTCDHGGTQRIK